MSGTGSGNACDKFVPPVEQWLRAIGSRQYRVAADIRRRAIEEARRAACNLARHRRWAVHPCTLTIKNLGKRDFDKPPTSPHGLLDATHDPELVAELWRQYPGDLVGIRTGEASGFDVLDIDIKHRTARAWWHQHADQIPRTKTFRSLNGGIHLYLRHTPNVRNDQGRKICAGVDVRGDGGFIIHWFSASYECLDESEVAPWADWLLQVVRPPRKPVTPPSPPARPYSGPDKGIPALLRTVATAPEGTRHSTLFWASCRMGERIAAGRIGRGEAEANLMLAALYAGLPELEARQTVGCGFKTGAAS